MMHHLVKFIKIVFVILLIFFLLLFLIHSILLRKEAYDLEESYQKVQVKGKEMSFSSEGEGDHHLVFLSGSGTVSPILDFQSLQKEIKGNKKTILEKFGYGFSSDTGEDRDVAIIVDEYREALKKASFSPPYILCPHSMSGIEALYWVLTYPEEIEAMIGLDMSLPEAYAKVDFSITQLRVLSFAARVGITRILPKASESDAMLYGQLTEKEKNIYRALFYKRTLNSTMLHELASIKDSARKVEEMGYVEKPMLLFVSNGIGTGFSEEAWRKIQEKYAKKVGGKLVFLSCPHYVHDHAYKEIGEKINSFLQDL